MNNENIDIKDRFAFGKNWANFLKNLSDDKILEAEKSLKEKLSLESLEGKTFLDIGSGSGLFSLTAFRLGAKVFSFDYDQDSVNCTKYLKEKYAKDSDQWTVKQGSVLDKEFLSQYGKVDILYSWGVLHHTGNMKQAFLNVSDMVKEGGRLFISIYNDQGRASKRWTFVKKKYVASGRIVKFLLCIGTLIRQWTITLVKDALTSFNPFKSWINYGKNNRGMSAWHDVVDWTGGYPFEVAKPEEVFDFFKAKGYKLDRLKTCAGGVGCNEYVFVKEKN
ncbi:MAG: Ubiquinone biosynthesis O-methyltransferase, mitochondrial [Holosporales bacterium]